MATHALKRRMLLAVLWLVAEEGTDQDQVALSDPSTASSNKRPFTPELTLVHGGRLALGMSVDGVL